MYAAFAKGALMMRTLDSHCNESTLAPLCVAGTRSTKKSSTSSLTHAWAGTNGSTQRPLLR